MYDPSNPQPADRSLNQQHPNQHSSYSPKGSKEPYRHSDNLSLTQCDGYSLGCKCNVHPPCDLLINRPIGGATRECPSGQYDYAAESVNRMNERVRDIRRLLEADSRYLSVIHGDLPNIDHHYHLDITLSYDSSSDVSTYSSLNFHSGTLDDTSPSWGAKSQTTDLRGIGQWMNATEGASWGLWQSSSSMDIAEDSSFDLARVHALAAQSPFEQYFDTRKAEEGRLNFQMYSSLP